MSGNPSAQPRPLVRSSRRSAKDRLAKFYIGLSADKKALLRNWLVYLRDMLNVVGVTDSGARKVRGP